MTPFPSTAEFSQIILPVRRLDPEFLELPAHDERAHLENSETGAPVCRIIESDGKFNFHR